MIKAIFWDCDNTLINTAELHFAKHVAVLKTLGIDLDNSFRPTIYSNNSLQNWDILSRAYKLDTDRDAYIDALDQWYNDNITTLVIRDGILETLKAAQEQAIQQIVVSNGRRSSVQASLNAKELTPYFDEIYCRENSVERKPHPEPYLNALSACGLRATDVIAIEDDPKGVSSAIAAGIETVHFRYKKDMEPAKDSCFSCFNGTEFSDYMLARINNG